MPTAGTAVAKREPMRGVIYDARGNVVRAPQDPRVAGARAIYNFVQGGYTGARTDRRALSEWIPTSQSGDADSIGDLPMLRARSADLVRNTPLAAGAINNVVTAAVGTGLRPQPRIDADYLGISEEEADDKERQAARLYRLVAKTKQLDVAGRETAAQQQATILRSLLERGDVFLVRRRKLRGAIAIGHCWQVIEADRVCNPTGQPDRPGFAGGIETDDDGEPIAYWIASRHPNELYATSAVTWSRVLARGPTTGAPQVLHLAWRRRPGQTRGIPYLAVVIEPLKQLARYGDAELMAAVIGSMFTVFLKSDAPDSLMGTGTSPGTDSAGKPLPPNYRLGEGAIIGLLPGESIEIADMKRPSGLYDPFVRSKLQEIGAAIEQPFEVLIKAFTASFSASRAAQLDAWRFYGCVRNFLAEDYAQPTYEAIITEGVAAGILDFPRFFDDPMVRDAWLGCEFIGDAPGQLDEEAEIAAATARIAANLSTHEAESASITGRPWEQTLRQLSKERRQLRQAGLDPVSPTQTSQTTPPNDSAAAGPPGADGTTPGAHGRTLTRAEMWDARDRAEAGHA